MDGSITDSTTVLNANCWLSALRLGPNELQTKNFRLLGGWGGQRDAADAHKEQDGILDIHDERASRNAVTFLAKI